MENWSHVSQRAGRILSQAVYARWEAACELRFFCYFDIKIVSSPQPLSDLSISCVDNGKQVWVGPFCPSGPDSSFANSYSPQSLVDPFRSGDKRTCPVARCGFTTFRLT